MHHSLQNNLNFFEVHKNIRFLLEPLFDEKDMIENKNWIKNNTQIFLQKYEFIIKQLNFILLNSRKRTLNAKLKIKFCFLKKHTKTLYFEYGIDTLKNKHKNQIEMNKKELEYLVNIFENFFHKNLDYIEKLKILLHTPNAQNKDIQYYFHQILRRWNFNFIQDLSESINTEIPNTYGKIIEIKETLENLEYIKKSLQDELYQQQCFGNTIEVVNLNYFLVNKKSKNYTELITNKKNTLQHHIFAFPKFLAATNNNGLKDFETYYNINYSEWKLVETYELLKEYKSSQKEGFLQFISSGYTYNDLIHHKNFLFKSRHFDTKEFMLSIYLFDDISMRDFNIIQDLSLKIMFLIDLENYPEKITSSKEKYKELFWEDILTDKAYIEDTKWKIMKKLVSIKRQRWMLFNTESRYCVFRKYINFCAEYKKITLEIGKIKSHIKALKTEQKQIDKTNSWGLILEKNSQKFLLTIPREQQNVPYFDKSNNILQARHFIKSLSYQNDDSTLFYFEALNLQILDTLCFSKENTNFRNKIAKELYGINSHFVEKKEFTKLNKTIEVYNIKMKYELPKNIYGETSKSTLLQFYQSIIKLNSLKEHLIIENPIEFENFTKKDFTSLDEFEKKLKEICYVKKIFNISEDNLDFLIKKFDWRLYKITSYDLEKNLKRENIKPHTKIWLDFWNEKNQINKYPIRIKPELKISFIKKDDSLSEKNSDIKRNRKLENRFLLTTNITEHACKHHWIISENTTKQIIDFYENFNQIFEKHPSTEILWYNYFIDVYENNSIHLSIYENQNTTYIPIESYELKEDFFSMTNEKWTKIYKNISYFQYDEHQNLYSKQENQYIDLQTAKLINGKIYSNWDISTYLNLKMISAKNKISHFSHEYSHIKISQENPENIVLYWWDKQEVVIYNFDKKYDSILSQSCIIHELEDFLERKNIEWYFSEDISIQSINNLKNALCWNMVWVIFFLQKNYPWKIIIRNFTHKNYSRSLYSLGKNFEEKILQKLSSLSLIPSNYKHIFTLKENNTLNKLWIIEFVN